jgi:hypothetical protein
MPSSPPGTLTPQLHTWFRNSWIHVMVPQSGIFICLVPLLLTKRKKECMSIPRVHSGSCNHVLPYIKICFPFRHKKFPQHKTGGMRAIPAQLICYTSKHVSIQKL